VNTETEVTKENEKEKRQLDLKIDVRETSACERHVTVTVSRADIDAYFQEQFDELVPKAEVHGFRTGRAPRQLVENKFRPQVSDQVKGAILMDSLAQVSETQDFSAISEPNLDFEQVKIPETGDLTYEFNIEVRPEFQMPDWKGLSLERPEHEFTDNDVDRYIQKLAAQFSDVVPVEEKVKPADFVVCNITSRYDGKVIATAEEETLQVLPTLSLSDVTIEGFDKLLKGATADDTVKTTATVSEFAENEELQGKDIELEFEILDVKRIELKTSEEVADRLGIESADALRELVRSGMEERLRYAQREKIREQISRLLTESATWELPPDLLRRQSRRELDRAVMEMRSSGFSEQEIIGRENGLRKNILQRTEILLKEHFILEKIAETENVEESPADYELEIARIAAQRNDSPRRVRARLERSGQMDALRNMIIERKVIDLITAEATFKGTKYEAVQKQDTTAIEFFAAGGTAVAIPDAKYDESEPQALPNIKERD
jgi:trigger factor